MTAARFHIIAGGLRDFLEPNWKDWHDTWGPPYPACPSQWTCVRSALFVCRALDHMGFTAAFQSGRPSIGGGQFGYYQAGTWESHVWVCSAGFIVDVTADQFGGPGVFVAVEGDRRYRPGMDRSTRLEPSAKAALAVDRLWGCWIGG